MELLAIAYKASWGARALLLKPFFKKMELPGYIGKPTFIEGASRISIGSRFRIFPGARLEVATSGTLIIASDVAIAQNLHLTCGKLIHIHSGACIAANVCITDTLHNYTDPEINILKQNDSYRETIIGQDCFIGFGSVINAGTTLGKHCIVGANSYVSGKFPDHCIIAGNPARVIKSYDRKTGAWIKHD